MVLSDADRALVAAAVAEAERKSDGEIVTILADRSDTYNDVALHYALLGMLLIPVAFALLPQGWFDWWSTLLLGWNATFTRAELMALLIVKMAATFLIVRLILRSTRLRLALTPPATKHRRVLRRAVTLFKTSCELKTRGRTGVLLYLSVAERRAEIVADEAIHSKVAPELWGDAMHALIQEVRAGRPGEGMAKAVAMMGNVIAGVLPRTLDDTNELPDRLIEL